MCRSAMFAEICAVGNRTGIGSEMASVVVDFGLNRIMSGETQAQVDE